MFGSKRVLLVLGIWLIAFGPVQAQRSIPEDNLAYPVLIRFEAGEDQVNTGSGFFLTANGKMFLVTAKHVLPNLQKTESKQNLESRALVLDLYSPSKDPDEDALNHIRIDLGMLQVNGAVKVHSSRDVALIQLAALQKRTSEDTQNPNQYSISPLHGVVIVESAKAGFVGVTLENIKSFDQVLVGNDLILYGYPSSLGLAKKPQIEPFRPLLRRGMVAGKNSKRKVIVVDCFAYPRNSGGPIVQVEIKSPFEKKFSVIGVMGEFVPFLDQGKRGTFAMMTNSGYSIAAPMDPVLELLKEE